MACAHVMNTKKKESASVLRGQKGIILHIKAAFNFLRYIFTVTLTKWFFYTTKTSVGITINYNSIIIIIVYIFLSN